MLWPNKNFQEFSNLSRKPICNLVLAALFVLILTACQPPAQAAKPETPVDTITAPTVLLPSPGPTSFTPTSTSVLPTATPPEDPQPALQICSPLQGYTLAQLEDSIANPFSPPPPGSDDAHQGVDIAELIGDSQVAIEGKQVNVMLSGKVAAVINNRFPYGNAVLIETPLESLPNSLLDELLIPESNGELFPQTSLTCPPSVETPEWLEHTDRSVYLMYAHLKNAVSVNVGENVSCGQMIDLIGSTGNAMNPHLHLELRIGPSNATFSSMAHYDASATQEEMNAYCLWRVSNIFQLLNPMILLDSLPE